MSGTVFFLPSVLVLLVRSHGFSDKLAGGFVIRQRTAKTSLKADGVFWLVKSQDRGGAANGDIRMHQESCLRNVDDGTVQKIGRQSMGDVWAVDHHHQTTVGAASLDLLPVLGMQDKSSALIDHLATGRTNVRNDRFFGRLVEGGTAMDLVDYAGFSQFVQIPMDRHRGNTKCFGQLVGLDRTLLADHFQNF